ncbi:hypothetical protein D7D52_23150 [Nocardia yunnanensis]|uniref:Uncharacterized protein n=1 Tax=Nocardia yunnanensis TaxID=2382165 RepID=A0A386ZGK2_9NOCA|nr:hypothetical protein D7D52_23150 [Nocardia yunnanensis]
MPADGCALPTDGPALSADGCALPAVGGALSVVGCALPAIGSAMSEGCVLLAMGCAPAPAGRGPEGSVVWGWPGRGARSRSSMSTMPHRLPSTMEMMRTWPSRTAVVKTCCQVAVVPSGCFSSMVTFQWSASTPVMFTQCLVPAGVAAIASRVACSGATLASGASSARTAAGSRCTYQAYSSRRMTPGPLPRSPALAPLTRSGVARS